VNLLVDAVIVPNARRPATRFATIEPERRSAGIELRSRVVREYEHGYDRCA
jgi:hypothetical protein